MKYELEKIDSLVEKYLSPNSDHLKSEGTKSGILVQEIEAETRRLKKAFKEQMFNLKNDKQIERYIQRHQSCLIRLCDSIVHLIPPDEFHKRKKPQKINSFSDLCYYLYSELEGLLTYIESYFGKYFNQEEHIPSSYRIIGQLEFREKLSKTNFPEKCEVLKIARYPIDEFISQNKNITYRKLIYLKELYKEVISKCSGCKEQKTDCKLSCTLVYLNFNSFRFFTYLTDNVLAGIEKEDDINKKIEKLSYHQKKLNQAQLKPNISFKPKQENIKEKVGVWIYEELMHYEKIRQLSLSFPKEAIAGLGGKFKLTTDMSVSQVAYFIRILVETGFIQNKNQKEVITFFANHIKTKKTEQISISSFRNKYYNIDFNTKEELKDRIIGLLNETQKPD